MATVRTILETYTLRGLMALPPGVQRLLAGRPVDVDGQRLATKIQLVVRLQEPTRQPGLAMVPPAHGRDVVAHQGRPVGGRQPIGALRELAVDGADGPLPARLYIPTSRVGADPVLTLLFIHRRGHGVGAV